MRPNRRTRSPLILRCKWEPDIWGRLRAGRDAAALSFSEQQAREEQAALDLQALLWKAGSSIMEREAGTGSGCTTGDQQAVFEPNRTSPCTRGRKCSDVLQQRGRLAGVERALSAVTSQKRRAANAYAVLLGDLPDGRGPTEDQRPTLERLTALTSPRRLLADRPDLRGRLPGPAGGGLRSGGRNRRQAAETVHRVVLRSERQPVRHRQEHYFKFAGGLMAPIFDAGRLKAKVEGNARRKSENYSHFSNMRCRRQSGKWKTPSRWNTPCSTNTDYYKTKSPFPRTLWKKPGCAMPTGRSTYLAVLDALTNLQTLQKERNHPAAGAFVESVPPSQGFGGEMEPRIMKRRKRTNRIISKLPALLIAPRRLRRHRFSRKRG